MQVIRHADGDLSHSITVASHFGSPCCLEALNNHALRSWPAAADRHCGAPGSSRQQLETQKLGRRHPLTVGRVNLGRMP